MRGDVPRWPLLQRECWCSLLLPISYPAPPAFPCDSRIPLRLAPGPMKPSTVLVCLFVLHAEQLPVQGLLLLLMAQAVLVAELEAVPR